jgi:hypothetical protein
LLQAGEDAIGQVDEFAVVHDVARVDFKASILPAAGLSCNSARVNIAP